MLKLILGNLLTLTIFVTGLMPLIIFVAIVTWFFRQFHGARARRWEARGRALAPVLVVLLEDALAIGRNVNALVQRDRILRKTDLDADLRDLLKGKD